MRFLRLAAALCTALIATACLPVTATVPVGTTVGFTPDPALAGIWKGHGEKLGDILYLSFFAKDDGTITAIMQKPDGKDGGWATYSLQTAALGANHFMNARETSSDGKPADDEDMRKTFPLLYRVNGDGALVIYLLDEKRAAVALSAGESDDRRNEREERAIGPRDRYEGRSGTAGRECALESRRCERAQRQ